MRKFLFPVLTMVLFSLFFTACSQTGQNPDEVKKAVQEANNVLAKAANAKDDVGAAGVYLPDAKLLPPNAPEQNGRDQIREYWKNAFNAISDVQLTTNTVDVVEKTAIETGNYKLTVNTPDGNKMEDNGKYVSVWKMQPSGDWKMSIDIFNSSVPMTH